MTTLGLMIEDTTWVNLVDILSLSINTTYYLQNVSDSEVHYSFKETLPSESDPYHILFPSLEKDFMVIEGVGVWVKAKGGITRNVSIAVSDDRTIISTGPLGGVPVNIQDPTTGDQADVIVTDGHKGLVTVTPGHISTDNSTRATLNAGLSFTGEWERIVNFGVIVISVTSNVGSATNGLLVQFSSDGTIDGILSDDVFTLAAGAKKTWSFQAAGGYYRVMFTNGGMDQTSFNLQTILKPYYVKPSSHRIQDSIVDEDDAELIKAVIAGESDINGFFENVKTYRGALQVDNALVHKIGISEHVKRDLGAATTFDAAASTGDTLINVADTTGFAVTDLFRICNAAGTICERNHFHITAVDPGVSLTLDRPLDNDYEIGDDVIEMQIGMNVDGTLANPISFKLEPPANERWQITRILPTMLDGSAMDDGKFGGIDALTNGVTIRTFINGTFRTLTNWKSNADLKDDMYDVTYSDKAPAGQEGLSGRWTFLKAEFVVDLDGATGDYLEVLVQDALSGLLDYETKCQGRLFGG